MGLGASLVQRLRPPAGPWPLALCLAAATAGGLLAWQGFRLERQRQDQQRAEAWLQRQQRSLTPRLVAAQVISESLAASIALNPALSRGDFARFAALALRSHREALALQLSPGGILAAQYPPSSGRQIGLNLLTSPTNREASRRALASRRSVAQGPFPLVQGGQGLVIRTPIHLAGGQRFWGFAGILLRWDALAAELLGEARRQGLEAQLQVRDASGRLHQAPPFSPRALGPTARLELPLPGGRLSLLARRQRPPLLHHGQPLLVGLLGAAGAGLGTAALLASRHSRRRAQRDVRQLRHATLKAMALVARTHDDETGAHLERCALYARVLGRQLQADGVPLEASTLEALVDAVPLHDIGKVGIPDAILKKPGPLTAEERVTMELHTQIGFNILDRLSQEIEVEEKQVFELAQVVALGHHENWDGSGYPQGLSGSAIPLAARIMAVIDVYDALASRRCYKQPLAHHQVVDTITAMAGSKFDPCVVRAFVAVAEEFRRIFEQNPDGTPQPQGA